MVRSHTQPTHPHHHGLLPTQRDRTVVDPLATGRVRAFDLPTVAAWLWSATADPRENARRRLGELVAAGLLKRLQVIACPLPPVQAPVFSWQPGERAPDCGALAWQLQTRWAKPRITRIYLAGSGVAFRFGLPADGLKNPTTVSHDLHMGAIYAHFACTKPQKLLDWMGEDQAPPVAVINKRPDAVLVRHGKPYRVIESGGAYPRERVAAFHEACERSRIPYELW